MPAPKGYSVSTLKDHIGHDFGQSEPIKVDQVRINTFADVTGDHQWIHVDVERAKKESPFGGPVAHGFLTLSLMASGVESAGIVPPDAQGVINYGLDEVRFLAPVPSNQSIRVNFVLSKVEDKGKGRQLMHISAQAQVDGADKPAVTAKLLAMVFG